MSRRVPRKASGAGFPRYPIVCGRPGFGCRWQLRHEMTNNNDLQTVVCLNWGNAYGADYINRLYHGVEKYLPPPFRFVCFTDNDKNMSPQVEARDIKCLTLAPPLCGIWWKLALLHPLANLTGRCLFLDLDVMVTDDLSPFFAYSGEFCIIHNWIERRKRIVRHRPDIGNSSVFRFEAGSRPDIAEEFLADPLRAKNDFTTEQAFMTAAVGLQRLVWWPEGWVRSFKYHCRPVFPLNWLMRPRIPVGTRILAFHGFPNPPDAIVGVTRGGWHKRTLPAPHIAEHWRSD